MCVDNHTGADVLALCTGMRPVVMIDYGGKMPELQERLCALLEHSQKVNSCVLCHLSFSAAFFFLFEFPSGCSPDFG